MVRPMFSAGEHEKVKASSLLVVVTEGEIPDLFSRSYSRAAEVNVSLKDRLLRGRYSHFTSVRYPGAGDEERYRSQGTR